MIDGRFELDAEMDDTNASYVLENWPSSVRKSNRVASPVC